MNYILTMTLSGSCMYIINHMILKLCGRKITEKMYYMLYKINILYFIIPLPFLKYVYMKFIYMFEGKNIFDTLQYYMQNDSVLFIGDGRIAMNQIAKINTVLLLVWFGGAILVFSIFFVKYLKKKRKILKYKLLKLSQCEEEMLRMLKQRYNIRLPVKVVLCENEISPFTIGIFKPIIFAYENNTLEEKRIYVEHELVHIKRKDTTWRFIGFFAIIMHWFNPLAWFAFDMLKRTCEYSCDEYVLKNKNLEFAYKYSEMLIISIAKRERRLFEVSLSDDAEEIEKRMNKIFNGVNKKIGKLACCVLTMGMILVNSLTVFAYEDIKIAKGADYFEDDYMNCDFAFIPDDEISIFETELEQSYTYYYDMQFIDSEGNVFEVSEYEVYATCVHSYASGTVNKHVVNDNGGCTLYFYQGKRCTKCGYVIIGDLYQTNNYEICPH